MVTALALAPRGTLLVRRNLLTNPSGRRTLAGYVVANGNGTLSVNSVNGTSCLTNAAGAGAGGFGVQIAVFTVGTDLAINTTYTFSGTVRGNNIGAMLYASGTGVVAPGGTTASTVGAFERKSFTFTTTATVGSLVYLHTLNTATTLAGSTVGFRDAQLETGTVATTYFDGAIPAAGLYTYVWVGAADASVSEERIVDPDTATTAIFAIGYEATFPVNTIVHDVPFAASAVVTFKPAGKRSGRIQLLFADRETCRRAEVVHSRAGYITLTDVDWPGGSMKYVPVGDFVSILDPETQQMWLFETGFQEVS